MLLSVHGSHRWLIMDGVGRGELCTYDQLVPVLRPIKLERPSATASTKMLRRWGPHQCEATCCFNSCVEQSHKDNVWKSNCWGTKDKLMYTYTSYHLFPAAYPLSQLQPHSHPLTHSHTPSQLQVQWLAHTQQHKFNNLTNGHSLHRHRFRSSLPGRNDSNALMVDKMTCMSNLHPGQLFCCCHGGGGTWGVLEKKLCFINNNKTWPQSWKIRSADSLFLINKLSNQKVPCLKTFWSALIISLDWIAET